tara:strand:- start:10144 stop:10671 length:528 start_codon:yes stop_codon:yes gene_type:complete
MKKNRILTESQKKQISDDKQKNIIENFVSVFNKIKRLNENELSNELPEEDEIFDDYNEIKNDGCGNFIYELWGTYPTGNSDTTYEINVVVEFKIEIQGEYYKGDLETEEEFPELELVDVDFKKIVLNMSDNPDTTFETNNQELINIIKDKTQDVIEGMKNNNQFEFDCDENYRDY